MSARTAKLLVIAGAAALIAAAPGESMIEQVFRLRTEAADAAKAGDLGLAESKLEAARALFPTSPGVLYRLAHAQAANGHPEAAVTTLKAFVDLGLSLDVEADPTLKSLTVRPDFAPIALRLKVNAAPIGTPTQLASIARPDFIGEGVLILPDGDVLLSGVSAKTVVRIRDGKALPFLQNDTDTGALFGMARAPDGAIWIAEAWGADLPNGSGDHHTGLLKLSPEGRVLARYPAPKARQLGDLVVDGNGIVYASDSVGGGVWRLKPNQTEPSLFAQSRSIKSPQGLALCGSSLLLADYSSGLYRVDRATGRIEPIERFNDAALVGIDGLVLDTSLAERDELSAGTTREFIATQNGVEPQKVLRLSFGLDCRGLAWVGNLVANITGIDDLSLGAVNKDRYVFVGHSQWGAWGGEGKPVKDDQPVRLYSFPFSREPLNALLPGASQ